MSVLFSINELVSQMKMSAIEVRYLGHYVSRPMSFKRHTTNKSFLKIYYHASYKTELTKHMALLAQRNGIRYYIHRVAKFDKEWISKTIFYTFLLSIIMSSFIYEILG